jgi:DNA-binding transcriptional regulator LsrR (DeoR family)
LEASRPQRHERKLDQAARAAWLYYVAGNTQDEIAEKLNVSRQAAQRLVSLAVSEKLIKFRLDHPLAEAMVLAEALRQRYGLACCAVEPVDPVADNPRASIAIGAAEYLTTYLAQKAPLVLAFSTGRTLRAMVGEVPAMSCPQHKMVSLCGAISRDGQASAFEVVMRLAERTGAQCFPMPTPVIAGSVEERKLLQTQRSYQVIRALAEDAAVAFVGISQIAWRSPLHADHFVTDLEIAELIDKGAVGEIAGWAFDPSGRLVEGGSNERNAGLPLEELRRAQIVGVSGGPEKVAAIRAALRGRLISGLITDERTAAAVLEDAGGA